PALALQVDLVAQRPALDVMRRQVHPGQQALDDLADAGVGRHLPELQVFLTRDVRRLEIQAWGCGCHAIKLLTGHWALEPAEPRTTPGPTGTPGQSFPAQAPSLPAHSSGRPGTGPTGHGPARQAQAPRSTALPRTGPFRHPGPRHWGGPAER